MTPSPTVLTARQPPTGADGLEPLPKIALIVSGGGVSGAEIRAAQIYRHTRRLGIDVEFWVEASLSEAIGKRFPDVAAEAVLIEDDDLVARWLRRGRRFSWLRSAVRLDAIESRWGMPRLDARLRARGIGLAHVFRAMYIAHVRACPTIFEVTSPDIAGGLSRWSARRLASYDAFHAVSESVAARLESFLPCSAFRTAPLPYFAPARELDASVAKRRRVTFAHRLVPRKNGVLFALAAARFLEVRPDWEVRVFGAGPEAEAMRNILRDQIATGRAVVEHRPEIASELTQSRIFVSLIEPDNYPSQSVLEAMAVRNALLLSDTGCSREKFLDGNGRVVALEPARVAAALLDMAADEDRLESMGRRSREIVATRYGGDRYIDHLRKLYRDTLQRSRS